MNTRPTHAYDTAANSLICAMMHAGRTELVTHAKAAHCYDHAWYVCAAWVDNPDLCTADLVLVADALELAGGGL